MSFVYGSPKKVTGLDGPLLAGGDIPQISGEMNIGLLNPGLLHIVTAGAVVTSYDTIPLGAANTFLRSGGSGLPAFAPITGAAITGITATRIPYGHTDATLTHSAELTYDTATATLDVVKSMAGVAVTSKTRNTSVAASSSAQNLVEVASAATGDPSLRLSIAGVQNWDIFVSNANSDELRILAGVNLTARCSTAANWCFGVGAPHASYAAVFDRGASSDGIKSVGTNYAYVEAHGGSAKTYVTATQGSATRLGQTSTFISSIEAAGSNMLLVGTSSAAPINLITNNVSRLLIDSAGLIGINGAVSAGYQVHTSNSGNAWHALTTSATNASSGFVLFAPSRALTLKQYGNTDGTTIDGQAVLGSAVLSTVAANKFLIMNSGTNPIIFVNNSIVSATLTGLNNLLLGTVSEVASTKFRVDASKTVASAAGAVWDGIDVITSTLTFSDATNPVTNATGVNLVTFRAPTITAASALTITHTSTVCIAGPPVAAGSAVLTNAYSLWVQTGTLRLSGTTGAAADISKGLLQFDGVNNAVFYRVSASVLGYAMGSTQEIGFIAGMTRFRGLMAPTFTAGTVGGATSNCDFKEFGGTTIFSIDSTNDCIKLAAASEAANAAQTVTYDTNVGPGAAAVVIKKWFSVRDSAGTAMWIPMFGV